MAVARDLEEVVIGGGSGRVLILYRLGFVHITLTYAGTFMVLAFVRSAVTGRPWLTELAPITGPMYQLFIFFMITDPRTTTKGKWRQCVVAVLVAVAETIFRLNGEVQAPFYALFIVGPVTNVIEILWDGQRGKKKPAEAAKSVETPASAAVPSGDIRPRSVSA